MFEFAVYFKSRQKPIMLGAVPKARYCVVARNEIKIDFGKKNYNDTRYVTSALSYLIQLKYIFRVKFFRYFCMQ